MCKMKQLFTYAQVQEAVANQQWLVIYDTKVYDVTKWATRHPGGELVIQHMLGRDATDQILTNHSAEALAKYLKFLYVGDMNLEDEETRQAINKPLSLAFRRLHQKMTEEGFFEKNVPFYVRLFSQTLGLFAAAFVLLYFFGHTLFGCFLSGIFLAAFWHQSASVMHDTGHNSITHNRYIDLAIGILFSNCFTGISIGWWKTTHFLHHLVTNDPEHDPHIQMLPFVATATRFFDSIYSTYHRRILPFDTFAQTMVQIQHFVYIPLMALARFVMYKDSFVYVNRRERYWKLETATMLIFWLYFACMIAFLVPTASLRIFYFLWPNLAMVILLLQLYVSHNHMSTVPMGQHEEYVRYQLRTTIDYHSPPFMDLCHGGLQFQICHHLFPRMPRHNFRRATEHVVKFCEENHLPYTRMGFIEGNVKLLKHLREIALEASKYCKKISSN